MATSSSVSYFIRLTLFSFIPFVAVLAWKEYASARFQTNLGEVLILFFMSSTAIIHFTLIANSKTNPKNFIVKYMMVSGLRLFGYLIIILIYALFKRQAALGFTLMFLMLYMLYSAFEVVTLLKFFKK